MPFPRKFPCITIIPTIETEIKGTILIYSLKAKNSSGYDGITVKF
jgi:hypothetical protein